MMLGGEITDDGGKKMIKVKGKIPNKSYEIEGTFCCVDEATGAEITQHIKMYNAKPQANADLSLSATDVSKFQLIFDILVDVNDIIIELGEDETKFDGYKA